VKNDRVGTTVIINNNQYKVIRQVRLCSRCTKFVVEEIRTGQRRVISIPKGHK
jgi:hypothetical protein